MLDYTFPDAGYMKNLITDLKKFVNLLQNVLQNITKVKESNIG